VLKISHITSYYTHSPSSLDRTWNNAMLKDNFSDDTPIITQIKMISDFAEIENAREFKDAIEDLCYYLFLFCPEEAV
jgi:hypothetical protein